MLVFINEWLRNNWGLVALSMEFVRFVFYLLLTYMIIAILKELRRQGKN